MDRLKVVSLPQRALALILAPVKKTKLSRAKQNSPCRDSPHRIPDCVTFVWRSAVHRGHAGRPWGGSKYILTRRRLLAPLQTPLTVSRHVRELGRRELSIAAGCEVSSHRPRFLIRDDPYQLWLQSPRRAAKYA